MGTCLIVCMGQEVGNLHTIESINAGLHQELSLLTISTIANKVVCLVIGVYIGPSLCPFMDYVLYTCQYS